jgi:hypothetical protein
MLHDALPALPAAELFPTGQSKHFWDAATYTEKLPPFGSEAIEAAVVTEYLPAAHAVHEALDELVALVVV